MFCVWMCLIPLQIGQWLAMTRPFTGELAWLGSVLTCALGIISCLHMIRRFQRKMLVFTYKKAKLTSNMHTKKMHALYLIACAQRHKRSFPILHTLYCNCLVIVWKHGPITWCIHCQCEAFARQPPYSIAANSFFCRWFWLLGEFTWQQRGHS